MYFINEQYIIRFKTCQDTGKITRLIKYRTGSYFKSNPQFIGNNIAQCCFSQSGRTMKQNMVKRFSTKPGCLDKDTQIVDYLILTTEVTKL